MVSVDKRGSGGSKWKNLRFPPSLRKRGEREFVVGGGNLRQEAWSVRRSLSHPTAFPARSNPYRRRSGGHHGRRPRRSRGSYVGGGRKDAAQRASAGFSPS